VIYRQGKIIKALVAPSRMSPLPLRVSLEPLPLSFAPPSFHFLTPFFHDLLVLFFQNRFVDFLSFPRFPWPQPLWFFVVDPFCRMCFLLFQKPPSEDRPLPLLPFPPTPSEKSPPQVIGIRCCDLYLGSPLIRFSRHSRPTQSLFCEMSAPSYLSAPNPLPPFRSN